MSAIPFTYAATGRIDASNAPSVEAELLAAIETSGPALIIDLSGLGYMSSAGLRVMLVAAKRAKAVRQALEGQCALSTLHYDAQKELVYFYSSSRIYHKRDLRQMQVFAARCRKVNLLNL